MLDFVLYMIFSVVESSALFYFAFKVFKIDLYGKEILFAGLIMAFFSHTIRTVYHLSELDAIVQYTLVFCFLWQLFRIHIFYAAIMTGMAYQTYMLIQSLLFLLLGITRASSYDWPVTSANAYILQVSTALIIFLVGFYIGKRRKGFDFIPDKPAGKLTIGYREKVLFALSFPSIFVVVLMLYLFNELSSYFIFIPILYALILYSYLYLSRQKDWGNTM